MTSAFVIVISVNDLQNLWMCLHHGHIEQTNSETYYQRWAPLIKKLTSLTVNPLTKKN